MKISERMMQYVPGYYGTSRIYRAQNDAKGIEFDLINQILEELPLQFEPATATWGLFIWERLYGLPIQTGTDYEARRAPVLARVLNGDAFNGEYVKRFAAAYGEDVELDFEPDTLTLIITFCTNNVENIQRFEVAFDEVMPAHMRLRTVNERIFTARDYNAIAWQFSQVMEFEEVI